MATQDYNELAEALEQDPSDGGGRLCWSALARVVDESPVTVFSDGDASGINVTCMVVSGPFVGAEVTCMVGGPLGGGLESRPLTKGMRVLVHFLDGTTRGGAVAVASVQGGRENPLPKAAAGVDIAGGKLQDAIVTAPSKRVGIRNYLRGAAYVIRLKGTKPGYKGELYIEADDQANSPDGENGTFIRIVVDDDGCACIKLRDAFGAFVQVYKGKVLAQPPDGESTLQLSNDALDYNGKAFNVTADTIKMDGAIYLNLPPGVVPSAAAGCAIIAKAGGAIAGAADISKTVFIGS